MRRSLLVLTGWLAAGVALGLLIGWVLAPAPVTVPSAALHPVYKDDYVLMVASAFAADSNLPAARASLARLGYIEPLGPSLSAAAERLIAAGAPPADLGRLATLADSLKALPASLEPYLLAAPP